MTNRPSKRQNNEVRDISIIPNFNAYAEGSCLIKFGNTHVICTASIEDKVPSWLKGQNKGWVTAEYSMLPRSCTTRVKRDVKGISGRSQEIQRLIGRSLRAVVDLEKFNGFSATIDCDVIQADGGTRTASITGGFVALYLAVQKLIAEGQLKENPIKEFVAAISCAISNQACVVDVDYAEDCHADVDINFVMTQSEGLVEVQGTAEGKTFSKKEYDILYELAKNGIMQLIEKQKEALNL
ncbi:MAG: ribonuclease PH [Alphaproteobacteria bacterium]